MGLKEEAQRDEVVRKSSSLDHYGISHVEAEHQGLVRLRLISSGAVSAQTLESDVTHGKTAQL